MRALETERLYLRPLKRDDLEDVHRMHSDPETVRFVSGRTKSRQESREWLEWAIDSYEKHGHGFWALELAASGEYVGHAGLLRQLGLDRLISIIHPENLASRRVAEKTGFRVERPAIRKGFDVVIYAVESHTPTAR